MLLDVHLIDGISSKAFAGLVVGDAGIAERSDGSRKRAAQIR
jgi:hypothetical protein